MANSIPCARSRSCRGRGQNVPSAASSSPFFVQANSIFAIDDVCPHMGASLGGGYVEGGIVTCPWHAWRFRLTDGAWADNPRQSRSAATPSASRATTCKSRLPIQPRRKRHEPRNHAGRRRRHPAVSAVATGLGQNTKGGKIAPKLEAMAETQAADEGLANANFRGLERNPHGKTPESKLDLRARPGVADRGDSQSADAAAAPESGRDGLDRAGMELRSRANAAGGHAGEEGLPSQSSRPCSGWPNRATGAIRLSV